MDHTKTKTFIAFINVSGKDKWWIDGNCTFEGDRPTILPYETKEDQETAIRVGRNIGIWDETTDVHGIILKVQGAPFEVITRREADAIAKEKAEAERKRKEELGVANVKPTGRKKKTAAKEESGVPQKNISEVVERLSPSVAVTPEPEINLVENSKPVEPTVVKEKTISKKEKSDILNKRTGKARFIIEE